jgi:hypothetical protein
VTGLPTRRQQIHPGRLREDLREKRRGVHDLLEAIEDQKELFACEVSEERLACPLHANRLRDRRKDEFGIGDHRERDEEDAVREIPYEFVGSLDRQARLSRPTGTGEGDRAHVRAPDEVHDLANLPVTANERGPLNGEVRRPVLECSEWRESVWELGKDQLEYPLWPRHVFQPMLSEVDERERLLILLEQIARGQRHEHLSTVSCRADSRSTVDSDAHVALSCRRCFTRVDAHADARLLPLRPDVIGKVALEISRRLNGCAGPIERDEEGIPLRVDLVAAVPIEHLPQELAVILQQVAVLLGAEVSQEPRRSLDVGEQEGDSPSWPFRHG